MKYPYFINPDINSLPTATGEERMKLIRHIAACVGDEETLRILLGIDPEEFTRFYPDMIPAEMSTDDTITSFISRFSSEKDAEVSEIEEIVTAPAIDYASTLENDSEWEDENEVGDATSDAISAFLNAVPPKTPSRKAKSDSSSFKTGSRPMAAPEEKPTPEPVAYTPEPKIEKTEEKREKTPSDTKLSEELFKLMVKNKNYDKALEIISELSLNNPKKSVYFAYQMRFIKKLIENQRAAES